ncbi:PAN/Apple domain-containing protein, partial [Escherichia coli]|nr:PAN/Apple domain-containing protein [Escherichia coli]
NRDIVTTKDGDYFGFDLRTEQDVTLDQCEAVCLAETSCKAFTYNPKVKWCFMKSDFNELHSFPGAIAGKVVETTSEPDIGAPPRLAFLSDQLVQDARQVKARLALTDEQKGQGAASLKETARAQLAAGNIENALNAFKGALAVSPEDADLW